MLIVRRMRIAWIREARTLCEWVVGGCVVVGYEIKTQAKCQPVHSGFGFTPRSLFVVPFFLYHPSFLLRTSPQQWEAVYSVTLRHVNWSPTTNWLVKLIATLHATRLCQPVSAIRLNLHSTICPSNHPRLTLATVASQQAMVKVSFENSNSVVTNSVWRHWTVSFLVSRRLLGRRSAARSIWKWHPFAYTITTHAQHTYIYITCKPPSLPPPFYRTRKHTYIAFYFHQW